MNSKISLALIALLTSISVYLFYQNTLLRKQLEESTVNKEAVTITPLNHGADSKSPFDQEHSDPTRDAQLPPETPPAEKLTVITFEKTKHDFGRINQGDRVNTFFTFQNTGKLPLVIYKAEGSCGCTVPEWPHEAIAPGETGKLKVTFDSADKSGQVEKTVTVTANTSPTNTVLTISSTIVPKDR